jgi:hypothetical protein
MKQAGVSNYSDSSQGWNLSDYGKFYIHSDSVVGQGVLQPASFSFPTSIVLNRQGGSETLTINLACREGNGFSPNKNDGYACNNTFSDIGVNLASLLWSSISLIPTSAIFSGSNVSGSYTGSLTITVNYL